MDRLVMSFALRAAAKVTLGTSLLGCAGVVVFEEGEEEPLDGDGDSSSAAPIVEPPLGGFAGTGGGGGAGGAPVEVCAQPEEPPAGWENHHDETFACCVDRIELATAEGIPEGWWTFPPGLDDETRCCEQILSGNRQSIWSGEPLVYPAPELVIQGCCVLTHGDAGCTPWGPPMPLALGPEDLLLWGSDEVWS